MIYIYYNRYYYFIETDELYIIYQYLYLFIIHLHLNNNNHVKGSNSDLSEYSIVNTFLQIIKLRVIYDS